MFHRDDVIRWLRGFQSDLCESLELLEPSAAKFTEKAWTRPGGGGGFSRVLEAGKCFEKAGVNFSEVHGELPADLQRKLLTDESDFFATGVSVVIHPFSPKVPTFHANFRYFEQNNRAWFGGGADLTPYSYDENLFRHFHSCFKKACDTYSPSAYREYKKTCDDYFYIPHREEHRGIGGIFFDYIKTDLGRTFDFVKECGKAVLEAYPPIVAQTKDLPFSEREKKFQLLRRGRYVEFNLVYDRGTKFGLETKGNIESILMSLPARVDFDYCAPLETTEDEKKLMAVLRKSRDWI